MINDTIDTYTLEKFILSKIGEALETCNPKTPRFYKLPKVHKPNNPGRPVVISIACHLFVCLFVCYHHDTPSVKYK